MTAAIRLPQQPRASHWQTATWADYLRSRDDANLPDRGRLFFHQNLLWVDDIGWEGIGHARVNELFSLILGLWFIAHPEQTAELLGGCLLEKPETHGAAPDLVLYVGTPVPTWTSGEPRQIDLKQWLAPDLVGEVSDTTLDHDLDAKKHLYASLGIGEYWVIDVKGRQVLAFQLQDGIYQRCLTSSVLTGLPIALLEETLDRLTENSNVTAANWFMQAIARR